MRLKIRTIIGSDTHTHRVSRREYQSLGGDEVPVLLPQALDFVTLVDQIHQTRQQHLHPHCLTDLSLGLEILRLATRADVSSIGISFNEIPGVHPRMSTDIRQEDPQPWELVEATQ